MRTIRIKKMTNKVADYIADLMIAGIAVKVVMGEQNV